MANCSTPSLSANTQMKLFSEYSYSHNDMKDSSVFILFIQKIFPMPPPTAQAARPHSEEVFDFLWLIVTYQCMQKRDDVKMR